jgi:hypothetical protein
LLKSCVPKVSFIAVTVPCYFKWHMQ